MKIFLHEITDQETDLSFSDSESWVVQAVLRVDEHTDDVIARKPNKRPIQTHLSLRKVDEVIVINGKIETSIELVCSRCANLFQYSCNPQFSALFCKDPVMAGVAHLHRPDGESGDIRRPVGQNQGFARHAHDDSADSTGKDLDITYLSQDYIELGEVLTEQLRLQIPFQPLCKESCKGICPQCGADLNLGRCACSKLKKQNPFSVLRDIKI